MTARRPRVAVLGFWHETNTAAPFPTTVDDFAEFELLSGSDIGQRTRAWAR